MTWVITTNHIMLPNDTLFIPQYLNLAKHLTRTIFYCIVLHLIALCHTALRWDSDQIVFELFYRKRFTKLRHGKIYTKTHIITNYLNLKFQYFAFVWVPRSPEFDKMIGAVMGATGVWGTGPIQSAAWVLILINFYQWYQVIFFLLPKK